jgi:hypothetical protein
LIAELRIAGQDESGPRKVLDEMVEDVGAVDATRGIRLREHIESLLRTSNAEAREEIVRCWASLIACRLPDLPETTPWRWVRVQSRLLGEAFLLVECDDDIDDARRAHPGLVVWTVEEALDLVDRGASDQTIRAAHCVKKRFGGRVLRDSDVPTVERLERGSERRRGVSRGNVRLMQRLDIVASPARELRPRAVERFVRADSIALTVHMSRARARTCG